MATLYLTEFTNLGRDQQRVAVQIAGPVIASQAIAFTTIGATSSAAFGAQTRFVRLHPDAICSVSLLSTVGASTGSMRMAADQTEYFAVSAGGKLSAIANT